MAATGTLSISGSVTGGTEGTFLLGPITISAATAVLQDTILNLSSGANNVAVPSGATVVIIQLPSTNAQTVTLKGVTGDTGLPLNKAGVNLLQLDSSVTTLVLTAGGTINSVRVVFI